MKTKSQKLNGLAQQMANNFLETFENFEQSNDNLTDQDIIAIGRELYRKFYKDRDMEEIMDNIRVITLLASGKKICINCGSNFTYCDCGEESNIVDVTI